MGSASSKFTSDKKQLEFIKDIKAKKGELKEILKEALKCTKNLNDRMLLKYIAKEKKIVLGFDIDTIFLYQFLQGRLNDDFDNLMKKYDYVNPRISGKTGKRRNIKVYPTVYLKNQKGEVTGKFELKNKNDINLEKENKEINGKKDKKIKKSSKKRDIDLQSYKIIFILKDVDPKDPTEELSSILSNSEVNFEIEKIERILDSKNKNMNNN